MLDVDSLARLTLFADLTDPQLEGLAHLFDDERHVRDSRVLRQGISGGSFSVVLEGEAAVIVDGTERARLVPGDFFGEMSILTGDVPVADVVVISDALRCAQLPGDQLRPLLVRHPTIAIRMLEIVARRLRAANRFEP
jgi:CRP-like cAMP-binding protein